MTDQERNVFITRFDNLINMRDSFHGLHDLSNPEAWLLELLDGDIATAEIEISALESKDAELKPQGDLKQCLHNRKMEYPSIEELIVAQWEGDQVVIDALETQRQSIKLKYPKP